MTVKEELLALYDEGKTITDAMELGYNRASAYRVNKEWRSNKETDQLKTLINESEQIKKVFGAFLDGEKLINVVKTHGISPAKVLELHEQYMKLAGIEAGNQETQAKINEFLLRKDEIQAEITDLEAKEGKMRASINELYKAYIRLNLIDYLNARFEQLDGILSTKWEEVDYSAEERERALITDCRQFLCGKGVRLRG